MKVESVLNSGGVAYKGVRSLPNRFPWTPTNRWNREKLTRRLYSITLIMESRCIGKGCYGKMDNSGILPGELYANVQRNKAFLDWRSVEQVQLLSNQGRICGCYIYLNEYITGDFPLSIVY